MKLSCEIFTKLWESNPSYRIYFNKILLILCLMGIMLLTPGCSAIIKYLMLGGF